MSSLGSDVPWGNGDVGYIYRKSWVMEKLNIVKRTQDSYWTSELFPEMYCIWRDLRMYKGSSEYK